MAVRCEAFGKRHFSKSALICPISAKASLKCLRHAQISILEIFNIFLWLKFSPSLNLNINYHFSKASIHLSIYSERIETMAKKKKPAAKKAPAKAKKTPVKAKKASTKAKKTPAPGKKAPKETKKAPAKAKIPTAAPKKTTTVTKKTFSVVEFSEITYLTLKGVNEWLKQGKLKGQKDAKGKWLVDAASLQLPFMEKLIR